MFDRLSVAWESCLLFVVPKKNKVLGKATRTLGRRARKIKEVVASEVK